MFSLRNTLKSSLIGISLLAASATPALAVEPGPAAADIILGRPIGFVVSIAGAGLWLATSPFTLINGTAKENFDVLVQKPADYTFKRPLGEGF